MNSTGTNNTADGFEALQQNTTGISNTADGNWALINNGPGSYNTASGYFALRVNTTGYYNAAIGAYAGQTSDFSDVTGSNNTFLGAGTAISTGTLTNATAVGSNAEVEESNALVLGAITGVNAGTSVKVGIGTTTPGNVFTIAQNAGEAIADGWITYSSRRWKTNIQPLRGVLAKIEQLRGVSYDLKDSGKHEIGVIAEEVGAVVPEVVTYEDNGKDARGVDYSRLTALLIEATKEQQRLIHKQQQQIEKQQAEIARLSSQVKTIRASLNLNVRTGSEVRQINTHVTAVRQ